jgi:hypothetical protein
MDAELEFHLEVYEQLEKRARQYAIDHVIPKLSKAVITKGGQDNDKRSLLGLVNRTQDYHYETTDEFRAWSALFHDMTTEARAQVYDINNKNYYYYENISMMLEAGDYFQDDIWKLILIGKLYVEGRFNSSLRR